MNSSDKGQDINVQEHDTERKGVREEYPDKNYGKRNVNKSAKESVIRNTKRNTKRSAIRNTKRSTKRVFTMWIWGLLAGMVCLCIIPLISVDGVTHLYYQIMIGEGYYGSYDSAKEAVHELSQVKKRLEENGEEPVLTKEICSIVPVEKIMKTSSTQMVQQELYGAIRKNAVNNVEQAYVVAVDDFTVTLASEGAVQAVFERIKNKYDKTNSYGVRLEDDKEHYAKPVFYIRENAPETEIQELCFREDVRIMKTYALPEECMSVVSAAAALTKEWEKPTIYTVEKGDCLSVIAEKYNMKTKQLMEMNQLTDAEMIYIGDELVVTVPKPEISVSYKIQKAYDEDYEAEVQYQDNDDWYIGTEEVIQKGEKGRRSVVAMIRYSNGKETGRDILKEKIQKMAVPEIIERGTVTPPTYIKPLVGGRFTSGYGQRWGRLHKGVDWACSIGTSIKASCGGYVASAGWMGGYGNCITIRHSDGKVTRYAHLSKILVSSGEYVEQGEKIGLSGNTGNSTGPHVHFEVIVDGSPKNPFKYLD